MSLSNGQGGGTPRPDGQGERAAGQESRWDIYDREFEAFASRPKSATQPAAVLASQLFPEVMMLAGLSWKKAQRTLPDARYLHAWIRKIVSEMSHAQLYNIINNCVLEYIENVVKPILVERPHEERLPKFVDEYATLMKVMVRLEEELKVSCLDHHSLSR